MKMDDAGYLFFFLSSFLFFFFLFYSRVNFRNLKYDDDKVLRAIASCLFNKKTNPAKSRGFSPKIDFADFHYFN